MEVPIAGGPSATAVAESRGRQYLRMANDKPEYTPGPEEGRNLFPVKPFNVNAYDPIFARKEEFAKGNNGWSVPLTQKDIEYYSIKQAELDTLDKDEWIARQYNLDSIEGRNELARVCPEYFERRASLIMHKIGLEKRVALINLRGIQSKEDLDLMYNINAGNITLNEAPVWQPGDPGQMPEDVMQPGMFSFFREAPGARTNNSATNTYRRYRDIPNGDGMIRNGRRAAQVVQQAPPEPVFDVNDFNGF